jgi:hypothetical protein
LLVGQVYGGHHFERFSGCANGTSSSPLSKLSVLMKERQDPPVASYSQFEQAAETNLLSGQRLPDAVVARTGPPPLFHKCLQSASAAQ